MKITHCISSIDESTGGPARSVTHLVEELSKDLNVKKVDLLTIHSENPLLPSVENEKVSFEFFLFTYMGSRSKDLEERLFEIDTKLFHGHGIWQMPVHLMANAARKRKIPYVISIRGMLEPWSLTQSRLKKKMALLLFQQKDLIKADCLHATGQMEVKNIRELGYKNPIAEIPNGININEFPQKQYVIGKTNKTILFLSRIHPKKGIEILINAWQLLDSTVKENWCIKIVGNGKKNYISQLNTLIKEKGLVENITIIGPKFGHEKITTYHEADIFVLPTYSENFGNVIAEALCCGVPVITTKGTPWEILESYNAGKWIVIGEASLKEALESFMGKTDEELQTIGNNGRKLIIEKFSIESVAERFVLLYQWILTGKNKPDFIYE